MLRHAIVARCRRLPAWQLTSGRDYVKMQIVLIHGRSIMRLVPIPPPAVFPLSRRTRVHTVSCQRHVFRPVREPPWLAVQLAVAQARLPRWRGRPGAGHLRAHAGGAVGRQPARAARLPEHGGQRPAGQSLAPADAGAYLPGGAGQPPRTDGAIARRARAGGGNPVPHRRHARHPVAAHGTRLADLAGRHRVGQRGGRLPARQFVQRQPQRDGLARYATGRQRGHGRADTRPGHAHHVRRHALHARRGHGGRRRQPRYGRVSRQ